MNSRSCRRAIAPRTPFFRTVRMQDLIFKTSTRPNVWQSSESKNKIFPYWQTFFNFQWTFIVHKEQSVIEWKVYACYLKDFLTHAVIQKWCADLEDQFQSYAWSRTKSWITSLTIRATASHNGIAMFWVLHCCRSMLMPSMQKAVL